MNNLHSLLPMILSELPLSDEELKLCKIKWEIVKYEDIYKDWGCAKFYKLTINDNNTYYQVNVAEYDKRDASCKFAYENWKFSPKVGDYYYFWVVWHSNDVNWYSNKNYDELIDLPACTSNQVVYKEIHESYSLILIIWILLLAIIITLFIVKKKNK